MTATFRAAGFSTASAPAVPMRYSHQGVLRRRALQGELMFLASVAAARNAAGTEP